MIILVPKGLPSSWLQVERSVYFLAAVGEDGLGPGVVLAQGSVFFLYAVGYLAAQVSPFDFAGGFVSGGRLHDFALRPDEFDGGSGFAFANGTAEKELRPKFLRRGGGVDFDFDGRFSTDKLTEHDAGRGIKITFEHGRGEGIGGQFFGAHHDPSAPGVVFFFSPFLKFVGIVGGDPVKDHSFFEEGVPKLLEVWVMSVAKTVYAWMGIIKLEHVKVSDGQNFMIMQTPPEVGVIENRRSTGLAGLVHVVL